MVILGARLAATLGVGRRRVWCGVRVIYDIIVIATITLIGKVDVIIIPIAILAWWLAFAATPNDMCPNKAAFVPAKKKDENSQRHEAPHGTRHAAAGPRHCSQLEVAVRLSCKFIKTANQHSKYQE